MPIPLAHPAIRMNYSETADDMKVMVAVLRRTLDVVAHWPSHRNIGPLMVPPFLAQKARAPAGGDPKRCSSGRSASAFRANRGPPHVDLPDWQRR